MYTFLMILIMCSEIEFASSLWRILAFVFIRDMGLQFSYSVSIWFWCQGIADFVK